MRTRHDYMRKLDEADFLWEIEEMEDVFELLIQEYPSDGLSMCFNTKSSEMVRYQFGSNVTSEHRVAARMIRNAMRRDREE